MEVALSPYIDGVVGLFLIAVPTNRKANEISLQYELHKVCGLVMSTSNFMCNSDYWIGLDQIFLIWSTTIYHEDCHFKF